MAIIRRPSFQSVIQSRAPQPARDLPRPQQPATTVQNNLSLPRIGGWGSFAPSPAPAFQLPTPPPFQPPQVPSPAANLAPVAPAPQTPQVTAPGGGSVERANPIEMNPHYQAGLAALDDEMRRQLAELNVGAEEAEALMQMTKARLGIEHQETLRRVDEGANERGIFNSGIRTRDRGYADLDFGQRYQDLELDRAARLRGIAQAQAQAHENRRRGVNDLAIRIAELLTNTLPDDVAGTRPEGDLPGNGGGNGNGNGGNGGGGGGAGATGNQWRPGFGGGFGSFNNRPNRTPKKTVGKKNSGKKNTGGKKGKGR